MSVKLNDKNDINIPVKKSKINSFTKKITLNAISDETLSPKKNQKKEIVLNKTQLSDKNVKIKEETQNNLNKSIRKYTLDTSSKSNQINLEEVTNMIKKVEIKIMSLDDEGIRSQSRKKSKNLNTSQQESNLLQLLKSQSDIVENKTNYSKENRLNLDNNVGFTHKNESISNLKGTSNCVKDCWNNSKDVKKNPTNNTLNNFNNKFVKKEEIYLELQDKNNIDKSKINSNKINKRGLSNKNNYSLNSINNSSNSIRNIQRSIKNEEIIKSKESINNKKDLKKTLANTRINNSNKNSNLKNTSNSSNYNINKSISSNDISKIDNNDIRMEKHVPIVETDLFVDAETDFCNNSFINHNDSMLLNDFFNSGCSAMGEKKNKLNKINTFHLNLDNSKPKLSNPIKKNIKITNETNSSSFKSKNNSNIRVQSNNTKGITLNSTKNFSKKIDINKSNNTLDSSINSNKNLKTAKNNNSVLENSLSKSELNDSKSKNIKNRKDHSNKLVNKKFLVKTNNINLFEYTDNNGNLNKSLGNTCNSNSISHKNFKLKPKAQSPLKEVKDKNYIDLFLNIKNNLDIERFKSDSTSFNQTISTNTNTDNKNIIHINNIINIYSNNKIEDILDEINGMSKDKLNSNFKKVNLSKKLIETREKSKLNNIETSYKSDKQYDDLTNIQAENKLKKYKSFNYNYNLTEESSNKNIIESNSEQFKRDNCRLERINLIYTYKQNRSTSPVELLSKIRNSIKESS